MDYWGNERRNEGKGLIKDVSIFVMIAKRREWWCQV